MLPFEKNKYSFLAPMAMLVNSKEPNQYLSKFQIWVDIVEQLII